MKPHLFLMAALVGTAAPTLAPCAPAPKAVAPTPPTLGADQALVYLYREPSSAMFDAFRLRTASFALDAAPIAELRDNEYTWFVVPTGAHQLSEVWKSVPGLKPIAAKGTIWEGGHTYHYRLEAKSIYQYRQMEYVTWFVPVKDMSILGDTSKYAYHAPLGSGIVAGK